LQREHGSQVAVEMEVRDVAEDLREIVGACGGDRVLLLRDVEAAQDERLVLRQGELPGLFHQIQNADPTPLADSEAPPELAALILKALSKKVDERYQSCQALWEDLEIVRQQYPLTAPRTAANANLVLAAQPIPMNAVAAQAALLADPSVPAEEEAPSTDDTVDLPVGEISTDDTVTLEPVATWVQRVTGRIDSAVSGAFARVKRPAAQNPPTPTGVRKR